jgi:hypothetical protein
VSLFAGQEEISMARKVGQIIARADQRWLIRVYLGRDHETKKRNYHNRTIHGSMREAQAYLTKKLRERDLGRDLEGAKITLNELWSAKTQEGQFFKPSDAPYTAAARPAGPPRTIAMW